MITVCNTNTSREELERVEMIRPDNAGRTWKGCTHNKLLNHIFEAAKARHWKLSNAKFSLSNDQADLAGAFNVNIPNLNAPEGQCFSLGFLTSNAMRRPLRLIAGVRVFVCNNGVAHGDVILHHKHTIHFNYASEIDFAMNRYRNIIETVNETTDRMKQRHLKPQEVNNILVETGRQGVMPWSRIGQVDDEFRTPSFDYGNGDKKSSWRMLNAFTHIVKKSPPMRQMDMMNHFRDILPLAPTNN